jgi:hypothetical protein
MYATHVQNKQSTAQAAVAAEAVKDSSVQTKTVIIPGNHRVLDLSEAQRAGAAQHISATARAAR